MPFKNIEQKKEYQRNIMALRRAKLKGLTNNVSPSVLDPKLNVSPSVLDPKLVRPEIKIKQLDPKLSEESRFYTFNDGKKIVRTKCGCNSKDDFYDWCLDNCQHFTSWRNQQIKTHG